MSSKRLSLVHGHQRRANPLQRVKDAARLSFAEVVQLLSLGGEDYTLEDNTLWVPSELSVGDSSGEFTAAFFIQAAEGASSEELDRIYDEQGVDAFYNAASVGVYGIQVYGTRSYDIFCIDEVPYTTVDFLLSAWHVYTVLVNGEYADVTALMAKCRRLGIPPIAEAMLGDADASAGKVEDAAEGSTSVAGVSFKDALDFLSQFRSPKDVSVSADFDDTSVFAIVSPQSVWGYSATVFLESSATDDLFSLYSENVESFLSQAHGSVVRIVFAHTTPWARIERYATVTTADEYKTVLSQVVSFVSSLDVTEGSAFLEAVKALPFASTRPDTASAKVKDAAGYIPTPTEQLLSDILLTSPSVEVVRLIAAFQAEHGGGRTLRDANGKELMAFAGTNSDPYTMSQYSYRQHAWQKIGDSIEDTSLLSLRTVLERVIRAVSNPDRRAYAAASRILLYLQQRGFSDAHIVDTDATPVVIDCGPVQLCIFDTEGDGLVSVRSGDQQKYFDLYSVASWMEYLSQFLSKSEEVPVSDSAIAESDYIFPASSKDVTDGRSHFPIQDIAHGRNAIARVNQYEALPKWYSGKLTLAKFVKHVVSAVKKRYPSIEVSKEALVPQPDQERA